MLATILPSALTGNLQAPASKSSMQRACAAALLSQGVTVIRNPGHSNDDWAALGVIRDLGASVATLADGSLKVTSRGLAPAGGSESSQVLTVNCGESGLGLRMFAPIIALLDQPVTVNGEGSLLTRPMDFFDEIFPKLGIRVVSNKGKLPLTIQGPMQPRTITIDGSLSSQFLTGLLFSFAAAGAKGVAIRVNNLKSKPYIDLTLQVMKHFGWDVENRGYEEFYFEGAAESLVTPGSPAGSAGAAAGGFIAAAHSNGSCSYTVEGDWSGVAFLLVAGAIAGPITVKGMDLSSTQADKAMLGALRDCGAVISVNGDGITIGPGGADVGGAGVSRAGDVVSGADGAPAGSGARSGISGKTGLQAFGFDATDCPDLFPPLVALASYCEGTTVITGVSRLAHKESDRGLTLQEEFRKMGVQIDLAGDKMLIRGGAGVSGARVHSRHDHRIAMACAVAGLRAEGPVTIEEAQAVNKSYPDFYEHLQQLGGQVTVQGK